MRKRKVYINPFSGRKTVGRPQAMREKTHIDPGISERAEGSYPGRTSPLKKGKDIWRKY